MKNILIHGLGQNQTTWNKVQEELSKENIVTEIPNLFSIVKNYEMNYDNLYSNFSNYCNSFNEKLNLCGLSLGGILAIDYAIEFPDKVNSLILIGTPYEIPKKLLKIQNFIFKFMPKKTFESMGVSKRNFISLLNSMTDIDIKAKAKKVKCPTLVLCGEKDNTNMEGARSLNKNIKGSNLHIIANARHEVNADNPIELSNNIIGYWKDKR